ncbi:MAG TPA: hypothetical protein VIY49_18620 [Bryobacteraceae bacterium]
MALPGGDPIAAALAAGETPSPELVAASGEKEGFSSRTAVLCFLLIMLGAIEASMLLKNSRLFRIARIDIPPDALAFRSQEILKQLGYTEAPRSTAYGFDCCDTAHLSYANRDPARRDAILASHQPPVIRFWYRQHRDFMLADPAQARITYESPPNVQPGMVRVALDAKGRLIGLDAQPVSLGAEAGSADWEPCRPGRSRGRTERPGACSRQRRSHGHDGPLPIYGNIPWRDSQPSGCRGLPHHV